MWAGDSVQVNCFSQRRKKKRKKERTFVRLITSWIAASKFYVKFFTKKFPINLSKSQYQTHFNRIDNQVIVKMVVSYKPNVFSSGSFLST